ncbi:hypothetical protein KKB55_06225 [Myxococcota bacterium]|nr:hypothetical protein [Myxococcota bacterium]MBU1897349.1 hypothetical protein [Myxococcota bacterium]
MTAKNSMFKLAGAGVVIVLALTLLYSAFSGLFGKNDDHTWQIRQTIGGDVAVIDTPGYYWNGFAKVWTWPRAMQAEYSAHVEEGGKEDRSVQVTFNDGGTAQINMMVRFELPSTKELRRRLHRDFSGNPENVRQAVRAHLINCAKSTAPLMSASEHQSARKSEFSQIVEEQLSRGVYTTRKVERQVKDQTDEKGKPITIFTTEVVVDDKGKPIISQKSPLQEYGIVILQFSVTGTEYDAQTRKQFAAKKTSFLAAEQSKAEREQEVQQRLMIIERGLREKAEVEAQANKAKAKAVIEGEQRAEVAMQQKRQAEIQAEQILAVARLEKQQAEVRAEQEKAQARIQAEKGLAVAGVHKEQAELEANRGLSVAEITKKQAELEASKVLSVAEIQKQQAELEANKVLEVTKIQKTQAETVADQEVEVAKRQALAADEKAKAIIVLAQAEQQRIQLAGAITEEKRVLAELATRKAIDVARALATVKVPTTMIIGGGGGGYEGSGDGAMGNLINLWLMQQTGVMKPSSEP